MYADDAIMYVQYVTWNLQEKIVARHKKIIVQLIHIFFCYALWKKSQNVKKNNELSKTKSKCHHWYAKICPLAAISAAWMQPPFWTDAVFSTTPSQSWDW